MQINQISLFFLITKTNKGQDLLSVEYEMNTFQMKIIG